jgi:hypothetical protein
MPTREDVIREAIEITKTNFDGHTIEVEELADYVSEACAECGLDLTDAETFAAMDEVAEACGLKIADDED